MAISPEILRGATEQYALGILQGTDQEKIQLIIEMLDRCSSREVCDLLDKSQETVTFDVSLGVARGVVGLERLCVTKNGVCRYPDNADIRNKAYIMGTISQKSNAEGLLRNGCNIRKLEKNSGQIFKKSSTTRRSNRSPQTQASPRRFFYFS
jgi:hypothetical protein